jgi:hypothetical protein
MDDAIVLLVLIGLTLFGIGMWRDARRLQRELAELKSRQAAPEPAPTPPAAQARQQPKPAAPARQPAKPSDVPRRQPKRAARPSAAPRLPAKPSDATRLPRRRSGGRRRPRAVEWV